MKSSNALKVFDAEKRDFLYPNGAGIFAGGVILVGEQCGRVSLNLEKVSCINIFGFRKGQKVFCGDPGLAVRNTLVPTTSAIP